MAMKESNGSAEGQIANPRGLPLVKNFAVDPADNVTGYKSFKAGSFSFRRDEYFAYVDTPNGFHTMPVDAFLRALMRDVAWGFFYGTVNFDQVFGTTNHYGEVDMFVGATNEAYTLCRPRVHRALQVERADGHLQADGRPTGPTKATTRSPRRWRPACRGASRTATTTRRWAASASPPDAWSACQGDTPIRTDANGYPVNRMFDDVKQDAAGGLCRSRASSTRSRRSTCSPICRAPT